MNYESVRLFTPHGELSTKSYVYMTDIKDIAVDDVVIVSTSKGSLALGVVDGHIADTDPDTKKATEVIVKYVGGFQDEMDVSVHIKSNIVKEQIMNKLSRYSVEELRKVLEGIE